MPPTEVTIGGGYAREPYTTSSLFNISGMSFGALSVPALTALSRGAAKAGIWLNTGDGRSQWVRISSTAGAVSCLR